MPELVNPSTVPESSSQEIVFPKLFCVSSRPDGVPLRGTGVFYEAQAKLAVELADGSALAFTLTYEKTGEEGGYWAGRARQGDFEYEVQFSLVCVAGQQMLSGFFTRREAFALVAVAGEATSSGDGDPLKTLGPDDDTESHTIVP